MRLLIGINLNGRVKIDVVDTERDILDRGVKAPLVGRGFALHGNGRNGGQIEKMGQGRGSFGWPIAGCNGGLDAGQGAALPRMEIYKSKTRQGKRLFSAGCRGRVLGECRMLTIRMLVKFDATAVICAGTWRRRERDAGTT